MDQKLETEQVGAFISRYEDQEGKATPLPVGSPEVVFKSALEMDRDAEKRLVAHAIRRKDELEDEAGRADLGGSGWANTGSAELRAKEGLSFLARKDLFERAYKGDFEWRRTFTGGVFAEHNIHVPVIRRTVQQQISRASNYFFATDPWFSATPEGRNDVERASKINAFSQFKFKQAGIKHTFEKAIETAFIRGEAIMKTSHRVDVDYYESFESVAIDPATGQPWIAEDGDYIFESDAWAPMVDPETGEPFADPETGDMVLVMKRDGETGLPEGVAGLDGLAFETRKVRRQTTHFKGADIGLVYYKDFLCPLTAPSVEEADCVIHLYDKPAIELAEMFLERGDPGDKGQMSRILEALRAMASADGEPKSFRDQARNDDSGFNDAGDGSVSPAGSGMRNDPVVQVGEFHMRYDVDGDGVQEKIMLVMDLVNNKPIFYDYVANVTPSGKRPFHVVRINPVDGRWHGTSQMDVYWHLQELLDLLVNRMNFSQSRSGRVDFFNPEALLEGDNNKNLVINGGDTYHLKKGYTVEDALRIVYLTDIKSSELRQMIEFVLQVFTSMGGVANANDNAMAGLDTNKLATGVRNIERSGQELFQPLLSQLDPGIKEAMEALLKITAANLDEVETYEFFEGDTKAISTISPDDVVGLDFIVELELTRYKGEQELIQSTQALDVIDRFYMQTPELQQLTAPLYRNTLKLFEVKNAGEMIVPGAAMIAPDGGPMLSNPEAAVESLSPPNDGASPANL